MISLRIGAPLAACLTLLGAAPAQAQQSAMTFFVSRVSFGKGADLGGLAGADKHCQDFAAAAGAGGKIWHAYLSTQGAGAVNARDRIGKGPWQNVKGVVIATSVEDLHSDNNKLTKDNDLTRKVKSSTVTATSRTGMTYSPVHSPTAPRFRRART